MLPTADMEQGVPIVTKTLSIGSMGKVKHRVRMLERAHSLYKVWSALR